MTPSHTRVESGNQIAPDGQIWECRACGKKSRDRFGNYALNRGWDEACVMNARLVPYPLSDETRVTGETP